MVPFRPYLVEGAAGLMKMTLWFLLAVSNIAAADLDETVSGWLARQTNVQTWSAGFTQTRTLKTLAQPLVSTGQVWFAAPQNFRWELGRDQTIAIRNESTMLVLYPRLKRVERYQFDSATRSEWKETLALLQSGFPRSRRELDAQFRILSVAPTNGLVQLALEPKSAGARKMMPRVNFFLGSDLTLAGTELVFIDGSSMRNDFRDVQTNADMAGKFDLTLPPGFQLVEPLKGASR